MRKVFLESHNLKNQYSGFGQFNYHLIKALAKNHPEDMRIIIHTKKPGKWKQEFGDVFDYKKYNSITRHKPFRIKKRYDLWHCLNQNIKIEPFYDIPYLLTVHDIHFVKEGSHAIQKKLRAKFEAKLKRCNAITFISEFAKKDTLEAFDVPDVPMHVIYNGNTMNAVELPSDYRPEMVPDRPFLFSIGDFSPRKNFKTLVEMLRLLPDYQLVLAGSNSSIYAEELRQQVEALGMKDRVLLPGKIEELPKAYYFKNCEAFVFPSLREGFGIPPIEAMQYGKPVFISNNTSLPEIGGEHSFYWDHYDPEYMVSVFREGMQRYQDKPSFYQKWYRERAASFDWNQAAQEYVQIYQQLINS